MSDLFIDERQIFLSGPVVVFQWVNAPGWPVIYVSPNVHEVFGYPPEAFLSGEISYAGLILDEDSERVRNEVEVGQASHAGGFTHQPYRIRHGQGHATWLYDYTNVVRDATGEVTSFLGYVIDITDQIETRERNNALERQLLHAAKLESLGVLASGIAHDFNNILMGVLGHASVAQIRSDGSNARIDHALDRIEQLAMQGGALCRQLLVYSGHGRFDPEPLDLRVVMEELMPLFDVVVAKTATFEVALPPHLPVVRGDASQVKQVVVNLVTNASESLEGRSGRVRLSCAEVFADRGFLEGLGRVDLAEGRYVRIEVADTGCGILDSDRDRIFDPFFSTKFVGRGLGLAAVQGILEGQRGAILVGRSPEWSTIFTVLLPATDEAPPPAVVADPSEWRGTGTILVVEDQDDVRETVVDMLTNFGLTVVEARDGLDALAVHGPHVDVVLLDVTMPRLGGLDALAALRHLGSEARVVLTSGFRLERPPQDHHDVVVGFLRKPYQRQELARVVRIALEGAVPKTAP